MNEISNGHRIPNGGERGASDRLTLDRHGDLPHSFYADNRQAMTIKGVTDVLSFDDCGVLLITTCGQLSLEGTGLHVTVLNTKEGVVEVTGKLYGLFYDDDHDPSVEGGNKHKGKRGFFGRLLS